MAGYNFSRHLPIFAFAGVGTTWQGSSERKRRGKHFLPFSVPSPFPPPFLSLHRHQSRTRAHVRLLQDPQQRLLRPHQDQPLRGGLDHLRARPRPEGGDPPRLVDVADGVEGARAPVAAQVGLPALFFFFFFFSVCVRGRARARERLGWESAGRRVRDGKRSPSAAVEVETRAAKKNQKQKNVALVVPIPTPCSIPSLPFTLPREAFRGKLPRSTGARGPTRRSATRGRLPTRRQRRRRFYGLPERTRWLSTPSSTSHCFPRMRRRRTPRRASPAAAAGSSRRGASERERTRERAENERKVNDSPEIVSPREQMLHLYFSARSRRARTVFRSCTFPSPLACYPTSLRPHHRNRNPVRSCARWPGQPRRRRSLAPESGWHCSCSCSPEAA